MEQGLLHLYWGDGKGKTTAAMGLALRALGSGKRVVIVQFLKGGNSGEIPLLAQLGAEIYRGKAGQKFVFQMTPEEKAGLCTGAAVPRLGLPALRVNGLHSQESAGGVCFPSACAAAASFDPEAARRMGAALGREARCCGAQLLDVPDVNLKRGPLSGRSADTWAEDPCLTGALAAAFLQGVQSAGVGGCAGRLAVVNQETDRRTLNRRVDERTLQELYLPAFETAVRDGQPRAVVCSAGQLNGTRICEDTALLTDTLRTGAVQEPAAATAEPAGSDRAAKGTPTPADWEYEAQINENSLENYVKRLYYYVCLLYTSDAADE
mgnify:CR=1 FL=1